MIKLSNAKPLLVMISLLFLLNSNFVSCGSYSVLTNNNSSEFNKNNANLVKQSGDSSNYTRGELSNHFAIDNQNFWAADYRKREIIKSADGGKTWQVLSRSNYEKLKFFLDGSPDFFFANKLQGWISGSDQTWQTEDGGETWEKVFDKQTNAMFFHDDQNGWMSLDNGDKPKNYQTRDGGKTWQPCRSKTEKVRISDKIFFVSSKIGWAFSTSLTPAPNGIYGVTGIAKTEDGGCHWKEVWQGFDNPDFRYADLFFINEKVGWFSTFIENKLFQTTDGGETWQELSVPVVEKAQIETFFFKNEFEGWLLCASEPENPIFYKTKDGAKSWQPAAKSELSSHAKLL